VSVLNLDQSDARLLSCSKFKKKFKTTVKANESILRAAMATAASMLCCSDGKNGAHVAVMTVLR
jgi:hypothetical protein